MTVYQDQIWFKSQCAEFENQTLRYLRPFERDDLKVALVDALVPTDGAIYITDNVTSAPHIKLHPEFYGGYYYRPEYISRRPFKLFNCFINRLCPNRQSWFYQFVRNGILDKGNVSFLADISRSAYRNYPNPTAANDVVFALYNQLFQAEHAQMRFKIPFSNFVGDLDQAIVDTKISLVLETYFDNPNISFSEKIFRALQLPRPFVMYNCPGAVAVLRNYGFDVWDDWADHRYDDVSDDRAREQMILSQIIEFDNVNFTTEDLDGFETRAIHNQNLLAQLKQKWPQRLKCVVDEIQSK